MVFVCFSFDRYVCDVNLRTHFTNVCWALLSIYIPAPDVAGMTNSLHGGLSDHNRENRKLIVDHSGYNVWRVQRSYRVQDHFCLVFKIVNALYWQHCTLHLYIALRSFPVTIKSHCLGRPVPLSLL